MVHAGQSSRVADQVRSSQGHMPDRELKHVCPDCWGMESSARTALVNVHAHDRNDDHEPCHHRLSRGRNHREALEMHRS